MHGLPDHLSNLSLCSASFLAVPALRQADYPRRPGVLDPDTCELVLIAIASSATQLYEGAVQYHVDAAWPASAAGAR